MKIEIIEKGYDMDDAHRILAKRSRKFSINEMRVLFYPYMRAEFLVDMGKKLERLNETVIFMVDMYTGRHSVARAEGKYMEIEAPEELIMPIKADRKKLLKEAPVEIGGEIMAKKRVIRIPDITLQNDRIIYKPFYIVECENEDKEIFHILFDAVMGEFSLLNA